MGPKIAIDTWYQEKNVGERKEKKRKGEKNGLGEKSVFEVIESEPSEREARETCERMREKSVTGHKVPAPALCPERPTSPSYVFDHKFTQNDLKPPFQL